MKNKTIVILITIMMIFTVLPAVETAEEGPYTKNDTTISAYNINTNNNIDTEKELMKIKGAIEANNVNWTASYTSVSNSTLYIECGGLGCISEEIDDEYEDVSCKGPLPSSFDWRNVNGTDWTTSIKNQGGCGSCVAFGTLGALEAAVQIEVGKVFDCDLSEAQLFFCGGGSCDGGWEPSKAAKFIKNTGVVDEACFPYASNDMLCKDKASNWVKRVVKADSGPVSASSIKDALIKYGPVESTMDVYEDFSYYTGGVYEHVSGSLRGGHSIAIVGYNDSEKCWICKNSWGEGWGEKNPYDSNSNGGWFRIKYRNCKIGYGNYCFHDVHGNIQPFPPRNPNPYYGKINVDPYVNLSWSPCEDPDGDNVYYTVYLNKGYSVGDADVVAEHINTPYFHVGNLEKNSLYAWRVVAEDELGSQHQGIEWKFSTRSPCAPSIEGPINGRFKRELTYMASTADTDGKEYYWFFDWGDDTNSGWMGPYGPEQKVSASHTWSKKGDYSLRVRYKEDGELSDWAALEISMPINKAIDLNSLFSLSGIMGRCPYLFPFFGYLQHILE